MRLTRRGAIAAAALLPVAAHAQSASPPELIKPGELSASTEGTFPPFSMTDPSGKLDGLEMRIMGEVARRLGLAFKPVATKWESTLVGLEAGQYDLCATTMDITAERQKAVLFCDGWLESGARALVQQSDTSIRTPADLKGKSVGVLVASTYAKAAEELGASLKLYRSEAEAYQDLANGQVQAVISDTIGGAWAIKEGRLKLRLVEEPVSSVQKGWAVRKSKPNLVRAVNGALGSMVADGTYAKIAIELIGFDPAPKAPIRSLL